MQTQCTMMRMTKAACQLTRSSTSSASSLASPGCSMFFSQVTCHTGKGSHCAWGPSYVHGMLHDPMRTHVVLA